MFPIKLMVLLLYANVNFSFRFKEINKYLLINNITEHYVPFKYFGGCNDYYKDAKLMDPIHMKQDEILKNRIEDVQIFINMH